MYMKGKSMIVIFFLISITIISGCIETEEGEKIKTVTADFTFSPSNPTTNDIIHFYDESKSREGNITSWYWEFDASKQYTNTTSTLKNPTYRYQFGYGKTFKVKLTVTDEKGNSNSITKNIAIVHQSHVPTGNDISLEGISHWKRDYDLDGSKSPWENWTYFYVKVKLTNNWDRDIIPRWSMDGPFWGDHFYVYTNYDPNDWWGYSSISPENTPEKLTPGESFTWIITFWIKKDAMPYKIEFAYYYDMDTEGHFKETTFSASL